MEALKSFCNWFKSPSKMAVGVVVLLSAIAGVLLWGGFNLAIEETSTEEFCSQCHMNDVVPEYRQTIHYTNHSGVRAACADCHLPHEFIPKWVRKVQAAKEVYSYFMGHVDTKEKFEAKRLEMAQNEWKRMKANNSQECRNCHNFNSMDFSQQKSVAERMHTAAMAEGKTCIDCHKGIAHQLPDMHGVKSGFLSEDAKKEEK
ncbi:NapC/NirT family cytochrome c [Mannheimia massilioguelmaensis]|uniref:NapC/NirT family cytochrome c n=1 Tax=Mannheimia massilioguelmaensis TaxID=1604354 RepID=UPI0005C89FA4|nr:NapC/NirT family cytochrome c [Mannheimia massilioguelmaensis]